MHAPRQLHEIYFYRMSPPHDKPGCVKTADPATIGDEKRGRGSVREEVPICKWCTPPLSTQPSCPIPPVQSRTSLNLSSEPIRPLLQANQQPQTGEPNQSSPGSLGRAHSNSRHSMTNATDGPAQPWKQWYTPSPEAKATQKRTFSVPACAGGNGRAQEWSADGSPVVCKVFKK